MGGAERVLNEEVAAIGKLTREGNVVLRLPGAEARVLQQLDPLVGQQLAQTLAHRGEREGGGRAFRWPEMRADANLCRPPLEEEPKGRQRGFDPRVVGHVPVL